MAPTVADPFASNSIPVNKGLAKRKLAASVTLFTFQVYKLGMDSHTDGFWQLSPCHKDQFPFWI